MQSYLPPQFPASWASQWGQDRYGLFMELLVQGVRQRFRWLRPWAFMMGSSEYSDEKMHQVTLSRGFWLADTACTQAMWQAVMGDNPSHFQEHSNNPIERVSWNQTQEFMAKLNALFPELDARLPTEAEWEYACRSGTTTAYAFGDSITREQVNYDSDKTVPVKSLPANAWGLYEMHGNVWEWCSDWYGDYATVAVTDPLGPDTGAGRVLRGGSWYDNAWLARSADRDGGTPDGRVGGIGFRLALGRQGLSPAG